MLTSLQNVLIKSHVLSHVVLLSGFGISLEVLNGETETGPTRMTHHYAAPEVVAYERRSFSADIWSLGCVFLEIWTVLCGETWADLKNHMDSSDTHVPFYHGNFVAIDSWCTMLRTKDNHKSQVPLNWIESMLRQDPNDRWSAGTLLFEINKGDPQNSFPFIGDCCIADEDSAESS